MKKKLLSLVCALALTISLLPAAQALEGEGTRAAEALASLGLVTGTGAGYAAEKPATQEQAAALLVRLLGAEKTAKADRRSCGWAGIPSWARSAVNYCAFHDLIDWSEYRAGGALDAELWCAMLLRALGCGSELGSSAARTALRIGLISRPLEGTLTRGDLFETALAALTYPAKDGGTLLDGLLAKGLCTAAAVDALGLRRETLTAREAADRHLSAILCLDLFADEEAIEADEPTANASAFLISPDGLAVTNYHSIDGAISGRATLITGEACAIERVIYYDADIDLAVIRIARTTAEGETVPCFHAIALAGAKEVRMGDTVYALGYPGGGAATVTTGKVTDPENDDYLAPMIESTAQVISGNSGGALINDEGKVVGITVSSHSGGVPSYSVPIRYLNSLIGDGTAYSPGEYNRNHKPDASRCYSKHYPVPDFGTVTGVTLLGTIREGTTTTYYYDREEVEAGNKILLHYYAALGENTFYQFTDSVNILADSVSKLCSSLHISLYTASKSIGSADISFCSGCKGIHTFVVFCKRTGQCADTCCILVYTRCKAVCSCCVRGNTTLE